MAAKKGTDFRLFPLKSLFIKGIGCVIAQHDSIDENNPCREGEPMQLVIKKKLSVTPALLLDISQLDESFPGQCTVHMALGANFPLDP